MTYAGDEAYRAYLEAGDSNEAFFYQQRWELLDTGALGTLGFIGINLLLNGILQITDLF